jgi:hypothetical protein
MWFLCQRLLLAQTPPCVPAPATGSMPGCSPHISRDRQASGITLSDGYSAAPDVSCLECFRWSANRQSNRQFGGSPLRLFLTARVPHRVGQLRHALSDPASCGRRHVAAEQQPESVGVIWPARHTRDRPCERLMLGGREAARYHSDGGTAFVPEACRSAPSARRERRRRPG